MSLQQLDAEVKQTTDQVETDIIEMGPEKMAQMAYGRYIDMWVKGVEELNNKAAKRIMLQLLTDPEQWAMTHSTSELERSMYGLTTRLLEAKFIMMAVKSQTQAEKAASEAVTVEEPNTENKENSNG
jgi:Fe2+ transport system protein B